MHHNLYLVNIQGAVGDVGTLERSDGEGEMSAVRSVLLRPWRWIV